MLKIKETKLPSHVVNPALHAGIYDLTTSLSLTRVMNLLQTQKRREVVCASGWMWAKQAGRLPHT